jgi:signal transduction histidine kinase
MRREGTLVLERAGPSLTVIVQQCQKLARMISQLLDVSRLAAGKLLIEAEETDLGALVESSVENARARSGEHIFTIREAPPLIAWVDPLRIDQAISNLLENAVKYSPRGSQIEIAIRQPEPGLVEIGVRDHGVGIPPDRRARLFERYYQAHGDGFASGMGLGLYVSRQIMRLHDGDLRAEFPEDGGTRFVICVPVGSGA